MRILHRFLPTPLIGFATVVVLVLPAVRAGAEAVILRENFSMTFGARGWQMLGETRSPRQIIDMEHQASGAGSAELRGGADHPALLAHRLEGDLGTATLQIWVHDSAASSNATEVLLSASRIPDQPESADALLSRLRSDALRFVRACGKESPSWELRQGEKVLATRPITNASPNHWSRLTFERADQQTRIWFRGELIAEEGVWPGHWAALAIVNPAGCDLPARADDLLVHTGLSRVERLPGRGIAEPGVTAEEIARRGVSLRGGLTLLDLKGDRTFGTPGIDDREGGAVGIHLAVSERGRSRFGYGAEITFIPDGGRTNLAMLSITGAIFPFATPVFVEAGVGAVLVSGGGDGRAEAAGSDTGAGVHLALGLQRRIGSSFGVGVRAAYRYSYFDADQSLRALGVGAFVTFSPGG